MATTNYLRYPDGGGQPSTIKYRPLFQLGERKREFADENPDILIDGKWWNSTNGSLYENNGSLIGVVTTNGTIDIYNGMIRVITAGGVPAEGRITVDGLTPGKEVVIKATMFEATVVPRIIIYKADGTTQLDLVTGSGVQEYEYTFVPSETSVILSLFTPSATNGHSTYYDNISVFETEFEADTEYVEQFTYGSKDGKLTGVVIEGNQPVDIVYEHDAPSIIEDTIQGRDIIASGEFKGKNACTAKVVFDGAVIPPDIISSSNISSVIRESTGVFIIYFDEPMDNIGYNVMGMSGNSDNYLAYRDGVLYKDRIRIISRRHDNTAEDSLISVAFIGGKEV